MNLLQEYECFDCKNFEQHFAIRNGKLKAVFCGTCRYCNQQHPNYFEICEHFELK